MGHVTIPNRPTDNDTRSIAAILANFDAITNATNGNLDSTNLANGAVTADKLSDGVAEDLGISQTGAARRGKSIIATEQSRTNTAYGTMTTADQVSGIVLPADGLIVVAYHALWKSSTDNKGKAAIFLNNDQVKGFGNAIAGAPSEIDLSTSKNANVYEALASAAFGLTANFNSLGVNDTGGVTTGQTLFVGSKGEPCYIFAVAGTYTVSVRFKADSGSVTAKERKLWVWTMDF